MDIVPSGRDEYLPGLEDEELVGAVSSYEELTYIEPSNVISESSDIFAGKDFLPSDDFELDVVFEYFERDPDIFGGSIRQAVDEVIAAGRTRRWNIDQCNNQEKAYVGVNVENVIRQAFDFGEGRKGMDFDVLGIDVDCKWSRTFGGWQIPQEAVGHICLLVYGDDLADQMAVGVIRISDDILVGGNRDLKRTIQRPEGLSRARWIVPLGEGRLPENFLMSIGKADRDAILAPRGGNERAIELFKRCEGLKIHRRVIEAIGQQLDNARRFRGETRDELRGQGFEVFNGHWKDQKARARALGGPLDFGGKEWWICLRSDGSTPARRAELEPIRLREAAIFRESMRKELKEIRAQRALARKHERTLTDAVRGAEYSERSTRRAVFTAESTAAKVEWQDPTI